MPFISATTPTPPVTPTVSRRGALLSAAGGLGLASAASSASAGRATRIRARTVTTRSAMLTSTANPASKLVSVRVFPSYNTKVYREHGAVLTRLGELGVKRMSHKLTPAVASNAAVIAFTQKAYFQYGIKSWLTIGEPHVPLSPADWDKIVGALKGPLAGMVDRVYGWNEPNHVRDGSPLPTDWAAMTAAHQQRLWARVSPLGIKVGTPQLWSGDFTKHDRDLAALAPAIKGRFDHIGWHLYPRGGVGVELLDRFDATYRRTLGTFPVVCTEAGYFTAPNYTGGAVNITEAQAAEYLPKLVDEYVKRGYGFSYFELLNDPDPTGANREAHLGLVRTPSMDPATWTPKPAFATLKARLAEPGPRRRTRRVS